jgi:CRP/FNR family transcriptional activator FtrB
MLLFAEADRASSLYTLMEGAIELFSEHDDRRSTIAIIRSMRPFVLAAIAHQVYPLSARTLARSELLLIPLKTVHQLIDTDPAFARAIACELANDFRDVVQSIKGQRLRTSIERLAEWMLRAEEDAGGTGRFVIPHDRCTLASYLGMEPESLSKNIAFLAAAGVDVRGRQVVLHDREALARVARVEVAREPRPGEVIATNPECTEKVAL